MLPFSFTFKIVKEIKFKMSFFIFRHYCKQYTKDVIIMGCIIASNVELFINITISGFYTRSME